MQTPATTISTAVAMLGAVLAVLGLILIPLPGPGFLVLTLGLLLLTVAIVLWLLTRGSQTKNTV